MLKLDTNPPVSQLRQFAWASLIGFPLLGLVLHFWRGWVGIEVFWVLVGAGVAVFGAAMLGLWPVVRWIFVALMVVAIPIGFVVSNVLLALIYFLMFMPLALFFRLRGRDAMRRKLEPDAPTYWEERTGGVSAKRYFRMY